MGPFLLQRFASMIGTLLVMSLVIFLTARVAGDPRTHLLSETASRQDYEELGKRLGLDQPLPVQYAVFLRELVVGDFGTSISQRRATLDIIAERMPATLALAAFAATFAILVGGGLGILTAVRRGTWVDK